MKPTTLATPPYAQTWSDITHGLQPNFPTVIYGTAQVPFERVRLLFMLTHLGGGVKLFLPWYQRLSNQVKLACHISLQARDNAGWEGTRSEYKSWYQCRMWHPVSLWRGSDILQRCVHSQNSPIEVWEHSHAFPHLKHVVASAIPVRGSWLVFSHSKHVLWSIITGMCWPGKLCQHGC